MYFLFALMWVLSTENQFSIFRTKIRRFTTPVSRRLLSVSAYPFRTQATRLPLKDCMVWLLLAKTLRQQRSERRFVCACPGSACLYAGAAVDTSAGVGITLIPFGDSAHGTHGNTPPAVHTPGLVHHRRARHSAAASGFHHAFVKPGRRCGRIFRMHNGRQVYIIHKAAPNRRACSRSQQSGLPAAIGKRAVLYECSPTKVAPPAMRKPRARSMSPSSTSAFS